MNSKKHNRGKYAPLKKILYDEMIPTLTPVQIVGQTENFEVKFSAQKEIASLC